MCKGLCIDHVECLVEESKSKRKMQFDMTPIENVSEPSDYAELCPRKLEQEFDENYEKTTQESQEPEVEEHLAMNEKNNKKTDIFSPTLKVDKKDRHHRLNGSRDHLDHSTSSIGSSAHKESQSEVEEEQAHVAEKQPEEETTEVEIEIDFDPYVRIAILLEIYLN